MQDYAKSKGKKFSELIANPCGLVAKTFFNGLPLTPPTFLNPSLDTFSLKWKKTGKPILTDSSEIAWKSDIETKFQRGSDPKAQWLNPADCTYYVINIYSLHRAFYCLGKNIWYDGGQEVMGED
jgi:hypothetical protein